MDTAIYWIEYVIKYRGAPHLRTGGSDLPWYQYHLLDVFAAIIAILIIAFYCLLAVVKFFIKILKKNNNEKVKLM